jgi:methionine synthase II (cobalamin-independent)
MIDEREQMIAKLARALRAEDAMIAAARKLLIEGDAGAVATLDQLRKLLDSPSQKKAQESAREALNLSNTTDSPVD